LFNNSAGLCKKKPGNVLILTVWKTSTISSKESIMRRITDCTKTVDGALAAALIFLLAGCGFALLHAFGGAGVSSSLIAPLFATI
jgi:hypothetical protein